VICNYRMTSKFKYKVRLKSRYPLNLLLFTYKEIIRVVIFEYPHKK